MVATISQSASSTISVSVGQGVRVRDSQKVVETDQLRSRDNEITDQRESRELQVSQTGNDAPVQFKEVIDRVGRTLQNVEPKLELSIDQDLNQVILRVVDKESGDLIRQIPSEEVLELDRFFADQSGLLIQEEV